MTQLRFLPATFAASAVFLFSSLSSAILPQPLGCGTGPACGAGFECTVVATSGCAAAPPCAAGATCPAPEPCAVTQEMGCTPAHCSSDAECAPGMLCHTWTQPCISVDCACAPNSPNCGCGASACEPTSVSMCTPRYLLACKTAADCGGGFTCEEQMSGCASSSAGPTPGAPLPPDGSPGAAPAPAPDCAPQPTGVFQCVPIEVTCQTASDCLAGWSCEPEVTVTAPACAPGATCPADVAPPSTSVCRPPYYATGGSNSTGTGTATSGSGVPVPPVAAPTGTASGTSGGTAGPGAAPVPPTNSASDANAASHESTACQMGHASASGGLFSVLTLLGAWFGLRRRRAQRA